MTRIFGYWTQSTTELLNNPTAFWAKFDSAGYNAIFYANNGWDSTGKMWWNETDTVIGTFLAAIAAHNANIKVFFSSFGNADDMWVYVGSSQGSYNGGTTFPSAPNYQDYFYLSANTNYSWLSVGLYQYQFNIASSTTRANMASYISGGFRSFNGYYFTGFIDDLEYYNCDATSFITYCQLLASTCHGISIGGVTRLAAVYFGLNYTAYPQSSIAQTILASFSVLDYCNARWSPNNSNAAQMYSDVKNYCGCPWFPQIRTLYDSGDPNEGIVSDFAYFASLFTGGIPSNFDGFSVWLPINGTTTETTSIVTNFALYNSSSGVLDHFIFNSIGNQVEGVAFSITLTAKDANNNTLTSYAGSNTLTVSAGTISPTSTGAFVSGAWTGPITLSSLGSGITLGTAGSSKSGVSNSFTVNSPSQTYGNCFSGVISEVMFFGRVLSSQEVYSLCFFPLISYVNVPATVTVSSGELFLTYATNVKSRNTVSLSYLVDSCILGGNVVVSSPTGTMNCYEAGYAILALLQYGGSPYYCQVQSILDLWASLQNSDGSWYQQYDPYSPYAVVTETSEGTDGNLKVDSGAALIAWAMSNYDRLTSGTRYKANVQRAFDFLRSLQYAHTVAYSTNLIANEILDGTTDTTALLADCGECLLSAKFAMDTYGSSLLTTSGYSVQTFANNLYYSIATTGWRGSTAQYYDTSYPYGQNAIVPFTYEEKISYTQAICSWAIYAFAKSAYQTTGDYSSQCEICLSYINTLTRGSWGGEYFCPYTGAAGQTQNEYSGYAAFMAIACKTVDSTTFASMVSGLINFIEWLTLPGGQVCDMVDVTGRVWRSQIGSTEAGFLILPIALALLAGAGT